MGIRVSQRCYGAMMLRDERNPRNASTPRESIDEMRGEDRFIDRVCRSFVSHRLHRVLRLRGLLDPL
jgi:hypothetical protein